MNIHEVAKSGKPFHNSSMIGAWMVIHVQHKNYSMLVHRDCVDDFKDLHWIIDNCPPHTLEWMDVYDLLREDWEVVEF